MEPSTPPTPHPAIARIPDGARLVTTVAERVPDDRWERPSPCPGWSVRDVLNHLTSEHLWAPHLLRGETLEQVGDRYAGDVLGADPLGAWRRAMAVSVLAWGQVGDPAAEVHVSAGRIPVGTYAEQMLTDLVVHAWDLGRGAGVTVDAPLEVVEEAWAASRRSVPAGGIPGIFEPPVRTESEDRLDQLVALLGRDPAWPG